jgi:hypothetical protein
MAEGVLSPAKVWRSSPGRDGCLFATIGIFPDADMLPKRCPEISHVPLGGTLVTRILLLFQERGTHSDRQLSFSCHQECRGVFVEPLLAELAADSIQLARKIAQRHLVVFRRG